MTERQSYLKDVVEVVRSYPLSVDLEIIMRHYYPRERPLVQRALADAVVAGQLAVRDGRWKRA